jgi:hypothetical protein
VSVILLIASWLGHMTCYNFSLNSRKNQEPKEFISSFLTILKLVDSSLQVSEIGKKTIQDQIIMGQVTVKLARYQTKETMIVISINTIT